ncbi:MAG: alpha/beta hydrolase [Betaproteobacteria bacterium]|nr:MAG: alpha/beta hydrolase [Betaproteobacteria bacterium]
MPWLRAGRRWRRACPSPPTGRRSAEVREHGNCTRRGGGWRRIARLLGAALLAGWGAAGTLHAAIPVKAPPKVTLQSRYFDSSDGVRLHVIESVPGAAAGTPVLAFVPGWSMPASIWDAQLRALGASHRTAALDPRGQGRSALPAEGYTIERRARDIAEFVDRYPRVVLIGWSLGVLEALHYVHAHGDAKVEALVLVDSSVGEQPPPPEGDFRERLRADRVQTLSSFVHAIFRSKRPPDELSKLVEGALRLPLQASIDLLSYPKPREHWRDIAWSFRKPLLYVVTPQFAAQAANLQRNRPGTRVEVFSRAGHALFVDEPQRFNRLLEAFVRGL